MSKSVLRLETEMHTAAIKRVSVDRSGRFLVTASDDKTARVWELATGTLLRVLRVPVGEGNVGRLFAVAISPDGNTVAVGGWIRFRIGEGHSVYIFDRESGRVLRRLTGLPNVINHLTFSPDGSLLAATTHGVHVWRTTDWAQVWYDETYTDASYGADFDGERRLVTSCYDGVIRLYDRALRLRQKTTAPGGKLPYTVRFSPDGRKIALGYIDNTKVDVLADDTLARLYSPDTSGIGEIDMSKVAWSPDGTMLYAAGRHEGAGTSPLRRWADGGRGAYVDTPMGSDTIMDIAALPTGGVVYGAFETAWGVIDANQKLTQLHIAQHIAPQNTAGSLLVSADAGIVRFNYKRDGTSTGVFQLDTRTLRVDVPADERLRPARTSAPGLSITDWADSHAPQLDGKPLKLEKYEASFSLAIAPDNERFLLGGEYYVRLFNRAGQELWRVPAPDMPWGVNIGGDGRFAVVGYGDGTIRWYQIADGKELLALFPHADKKRWVAWTPAVYYDASAGGDDLVGWQVNHGPDKEATFSPFGLFRSTRFRPDIIAKALSAGATDR
ncbi:MAG: WD40 repeat domain-containing protein [Pyrinomonadaceae bacterium]